ncbi:MAG: hypothetical protein WBB23_17660 [Desulforhopalus sp.]
MRDKCWVRGYFISTVGTDGEVVHTYEIRKKKIIAKNCRSFRRRPTKCWSVNLLIYLFERFTILNAIGFAGGYLLALL